MGSCEATDSFPKISFIPASHKGDALQKTKSNAPGRLNLVANLLIGKTIAPKTLFWEDFNVDKKTGRMSGYIKHAG